MEFEVTQRGALVDEKMTVEITAGTYTLFFKDKLLDAIMDNFADGAIVSELDKMTVAEINYGPMSSEGIRTPEATLRVHQYKGSKIYSMNESPWSGASDAYLIPYHLYKELRDEVDSDFAEAHYEIASDTRLGVVSSNELNNYAPDYEKIYTLNFFISDWLSYKSSNPRYSPNGLNALANTINDLNTE